MRYWRTSIFWFSYIGLLLPALLVFSLPGAIFINESTGAVKGIGILLSQELLALLVPWLFAREAAKSIAERKARNEQRQRGFPVIQRAAVDGAPR